MKYRLVKCSTCDGEGAVGYGWWIFKFSFACPACEGSGWEKEIIDSTPAEHKESLDFTQGASEERTTLRQAPYPNVAHF